MIFPCTEFFFSHFPCFPELVGTLHFALATFGLTGSLNVPEIFAISLVHLLIGLHAHEYVQCKILFPTYDKIQNNSGFNKLVNLYNIYIYLIL